MSNSKERRIYVLRPSQLSAETIAVTFAKTSRSPKAFDEIAAELDQEKSSKFSEKWIVGYGHASVAEHAVVHLALENISRLAIETVEGNRLASYTEKSTRYQEWESDAFYTPLEIKNSEFEKLYDSTVKMLFETYKEVLPVLRQWSETTTPKLENETEKSWQNRARTKAVDISRFLLPASSLANVGVTMNARTLEYAIRKMLSSRLAEVREMGEKVKAVALQEVPTLVKYANPMHHIEPIENYLSSAGRCVESNPRSWCQLLSFDAEGENKVIASLLYRYSNSDYHSCLEHTMSMPTSAKRELIDKLFEHTNMFDTPPRELEYSSYQFEILMDQGAYFEFKRHRMMTQTPKPLSTNFGFSVPIAFTYAGLEDVYITAMKKAKVAYEKIATWNPSVASYVVPNGFNRLVLFNLNLRELFHFSRIRCNPNAHFSIRRVGRGMIEKIQVVHPLFVEHLCLNNEESAKSLAETYFSHLAMEYK